MKTSAGAAFSRACSRPARSCWARASTPRSLRPQRSAQATPGPIGATLHPSVFLGIDTDGTVFIVTHRSEMGTGIRTSLPLVAADELDADWKRVKIEQAIGDPRYGDQNTDGSHSIRDFLRCLARGRRHRAVDADTARRRSNGSVRQAECVDRTARRRPSRRAAASSAYGALAARRCETAGAEEGRAEVQAEDRRGASSARMPSYDLHELVHRQGASRHGRPHRRHGVRVHRASAGSRRHGEVVRRQSGADGKGVQQTVATRPVQAAARFSAARRRRGDRRQHLGGVSGPQETQGEWDDGPNATYDSGAI